MYFPTVSLMRVRLHCAQARYRARRIRPAGVLHIAREVVGLAALAGWVAVWIHTAARMLSAGG
ncbi:MAG: hypothetical protein RQ847_08510 [Wenzhouxiangellaceae bacterium]|nr:hypothetical protein [Wenzhouxiangellaceae bacterium]